MEFRWSLQNARPPGTPVPTGQYTKSRLPRNLSNNALISAFAPENMAIISANTMIRSLSLFHLTLAAVLVKNPKLIADQSVIMVLGGSMQLVRSSHLPCEILLTVIASAARFRGPVRSPRLRRRPLRLPRRQRPHRRIAPHRGVRRVLGRADTRSSRLPVRTHRIHVLVQGGWNVWWS